jgi:hypothetical protein
VARAVARRPPFDLAALASLRARVPGAENALTIGVSDAGFSTQELHVACGPDDLFAAWSPGA